MSLLLQHIDLGAFSASLLGPVQILAMPLAKWTFPSKNTTKSMLVWGFAPDPVGGANSTPQIHSWLQGGCFAAGGEGIEGTTKGTEGREGIKG